MNAVGPLTVCAASYKCQLPCNAYIPTQMTPPQRRIEDRIRELCERVVAATDGDLEVALQELSQLLRATITHMRESATRLLVEGTSLNEPRRRATDREIEPAEH